MTSSLRFHARSCTHVGQLRQVNQDAHGTAPGVFVVADGLGGHAAGEVASALAVAAIAILIVAVLMVYTRPF